MAVGPASVVGPARLAGRTTRRRGVLEREGVFSWLMLAPGVAFLLAFVAYPFFYGISLSLQDRPVTRPGVFVGLANFAALTHDAVFWQVTRNTFVSLRSGSSCRSYWRPPPFTASATRKGKSPPWRAPTKAPPV